MASDDVGVREGCVGSSIGSGRVLPKMIIPLPEFTSNHPLVYIGERFRRSSATSVILLDSNTFACCQFNAHRMFLVKFDLESKQYRIVQKIDTTYEGRPCETDLMASDGGGSLITTNFFLNSCSKYHFDGHQIKFENDIKYSAGDRVHGVKFLSKNIAAVTTRGSAAGVHFFDLNSLERVLVIGTPAQGAQDVFFLSEDRVAIVTTLGHPNLRPFKIYSSRIHLVKFNLSKRKVNLIHSREFPASHFDAISGSDNKIFITDQYNNLVRVLNADSLEDCELITGYTFPHGIDVRFNIIAVSNYGDNTISLHKMNAPQSCAVV